MSILEQLADIRQRAGLDPLPNPHRIEGFDNGIPPPPLSVGELSWRTAPPTPSPSLPDFSDEALEASPLVALGTAPAELPPPMTAMTAMTAFPVNLPAMVPDGLWVSGSMATADGNQTELSETDQRAIKRIILESVHRRIKLQLDQVRQAAPRRVRKKPIEATKAPEPIQPVKRKRGRPRKALPTTT